MPCKLCHWKMTNYKRQSPYMVVFSIFSGSTVLYEYMSESFRNEVNILFDNTHVRIKIYIEFYYGIIYLANEGRHVRIKILLLLTTCTVPS